MYCKHKNITNLFYTCCINIVQMFQISQYRKMLCNILSKYFKFIVNELYILYFVQKVNFKNSHLVILKYLISN